MKPWVQKMRHFQTYKMSIWFDMFRWTIWKLWPILQNFQKKKKKKKGGGKVYSRSVRDFQCLCSFKLTSGIVIKVFPFSKGKTFMYFVWLLLCRPDENREATYCYSSVSLLLFFLFLFLSFFCPPYIWEVTEDDVMNLWIMLDECLEICMHNLNFSE